jgi:hypothetical protein
VDQDLVIEASSARKHVPGGAFAGGMTPSRSSVDVPGAVGVMETVNNCQLVVKVPAVVFEATSVPPLISLTMSLNVAPAESPRTQMLAV